MKYAAFLLLFLLPGCVADQRAKKEGARQEIKIEEPKQEEKKPAPRVVPADEIKTASNNDNQQNQSGLVNAALGKFAETLKTEVTGIRSDVDIQLTAQNKVVAKAFTDLKVELNAAVNAKVDAALKAQVETQTAWNQQVDKFQQEMKAGRDNFSNTVQFTAGMQSILEKSYQSQIDTVKEFCWMFVALISAGLAYLKLRENNDTKKDMAREELEHAEDMALIEARKKTSVIQRGKHSE